MNRYLAKIALGLPEHVKHEWHYARCVSPLEKVARFFQDCTEIEGSLTPGYGFGTWGVERCAILSVCTNNYVKLLEGVRDFLRAFDQTCAYVEIAKADARDRFSEWQTEEWRLFPSGVLRLGFIGGERGHPDDLPELKAYAFGHPDDLPVEDSEVDSRRYSHPHYK